MSNCLETGETVPAKPILRKSSLRDKIIETPSDHFNGIQMIIDENPFPLDLCQMLDRPYDVYAGDATPIGGGAGMDMNTGVRSCLLSCKIQA